MADNPQQHDLAYIPGFRDAPEWAQFVQFCTLRGWVFTDAQPHVYKDGVSSVHGVRYVKACDTAGIVFLRNHKNYTGKSRPWPDAMP